MATKPVLVEKKQEGGYCNRCWVEYYSFDAKNHATPESCFAYLRDKVRASEEAARQAIEVRDYLNSILGRIQSATFFPLPEKKNV